MLLYYTVCMDTAQYSLTTLYPTLNLQTNRAYYTSVFKKTVHHLMNLHE